MKTYFMFLFISIVLSNSLSARSITLTWEPVGDQDLRTYRIHWGSTSRQYDNFTDVGMETSYTLSALQDDVKYYFVVTAIDFWGNESEFSNEAISSGGQQQPSLPERFELKEAYPNPFNAQTVFDFEVPLDSHIKISVYNYLGQEIKVLQDRGFEAGYHRSIWDGTDNNDNPVATGTYFCVLQVDKVRITRSMILLR